MKDYLIFATRPSAQARWQTQHVIKLLKDHWPGLSCIEYVISTKGDQVLDKPLPEIGGKGLFTLELEEVLAEERVDAVVHSLQDLPTEDSPGLMVGAIPERADPRDVYICPSGSKLADLPPASLVGTSSLRRQAQLLHYRPDLRVESIRGNVDTRIRKVTEGQFDAILLAAAGVTRLDLGAHITQYLPLELMAPAPGQGALAIQCRTDDEDTRKRLKAINHAPTNQAVSAERAFLAGLGVGCSLPVGAYAVVESGAISLQAVVASPDGSRLMRFAASGEDPLELGTQLARQALAEGAGELLS
jgi:hydroxymethylbilane synthase